MGDPRTKIRVPDEVAELVRGMHPHLKRKLKVSLKIVMSNPDEGKALRDELAGLRSFRVGRFRIVYQVQRGQVEIVAIGPREQIYQDTYRLLKRKDRA
jgi:mRNA interferase RelE/StbE